MATGFKLGPGGLGDPFMGISGIKRFTRGRSYLTSSGVATLDEHLGSGLTVGGITLVEGDFGERFSFLLARHFIAQGIMWGHNTLLISDCNLDSFLKRLPSPVSSHKSPADIEINQQNSSESEKMQIAWRYQEKTSVEAQLHAKKSSIASRFDLAKKMEIPEDYLSSKCATLPLDEQAERNSALCEVLLRFIQEYVSKFHSTTKIEPEIVTPRSKRQMTRIVLSGLFPGYVDNVEDLRRFVHRLKRLVAGCACTVLLLLPPHAFLDPANDLPWFRYVCDCSIRLEAFATAQTGASHPAYAEEYLGLVDLMRLPVISTVAGGLDCLARPETVNLAFKVKRRQFLVEPLFIPPDLSETVSRSSQAEPILHHLPAGGAQLAGSGTRSVGHAHKDIDF